MQLKCCGEIAEIAADIMMIVNGIYSQIEGEEEKETFKFAFQMVTMSSTKIWTDTPNGTGVYMAIPKRREERND